MYDDKMVELYQHMVRERHRIWQARQNWEPGPWTTDPVLSKRKFTNMFRVLDPGSQFVFELEADNPWDTLARLVFYRLTNLPASWYEMKAVLGRFPVAADFTERPESIAGILQSRRDDGHRVFSGAYVIVPEPGTSNDKIEGAVRVTARFLSTHAWDFMSAARQRERFAALRATPGLGPFLSMQILTDWTYLQDTQPSLGFVVAGPGAIRGAALLNHTAKPEDLIRDLSYDWNVAEFPRLAGRSLTPMDVQNTLCEFSKYMAETVAPRRKNPYKPAHPGAQPKARLPYWW